MKMYIGRSKKIMYVLSMVVLLSSMVVFAKQAQQGPQEIEVCGLIGMIEPDSIGVGVQF